MIDKFWAMELPMDDKQAKLSPLQHLLSILGIIGAIIGASVTLLNQWGSIPGWGRYAILSLVSIVTFLYAIIPIGQCIRKQIRLIKQGKMQRHMIGQLASLLPEACFLFDPNLNCSLQYYVDSVRNAVVQNQQLKSDIKRLAERLRILGDWHCSLLTFARGKLCHKADYTNVVRDVTRFYHDLADVVWEFADIALPEETSIKAYKDSERMAKEKFNQHIGRIEELLGKIAASNSQLNAPTFHRF